METLERPAVPLPDLNRIRVQPFIDMYLDGDFLPEGVEPAEVTAEDTVNDFINNPDDWESTLHTFLVSRGAAIARRRESHLKRRPEDAYEENAKAAFDFVSEYKHIVMAPHTIAMARQIDSTDVGEIQKAETSVQSLEATLWKLYLGAAQVVQKEEQHTGLWRHFEHATLAATAVVLKYPHVTRSSLYEELEDPTTWLANSFFNALPFASDLFIEAAIGYAQHHPLTPLSAENLTATVGAWLPYFIDLQSTYYQTQDIVTLGWNLTKALNDPGSGKSLPTTRWLPALDKYEKGNIKPLYTAAAEYSSSHLIHNNAPKAVHHSLAKGRLPKSRRGRCAGQFEAVDANSESFTPAGTMMRSCLAVTARTIFASPKCREAIRRASRNHCRIPID